MGINVKHAGKHWLSDVWISDGGDCGNPTGIVSRPQSPITAGYERRTTVKSGGGLASHCPRSLLAPGQTGEEVVVVGGVQEDTGAYP